MGDGQLPGRASETGELSLGGGEGTRRLPPDPDLCAAGLGHQGRPGPGRGLHPDQLCVRRFRRFRVSEQLGDVSPVRKRLQAVHPQLPVLREGPGSPADPGPPDPGSLPDAGVRPGPAPHPGLTVTSSPSQVQRPSRIRASTPGTRPPRTTPGCTTARVRPAGRRSEPPAASPTAAPETSRSARRSSRASSTSAPADTAAAPSTGSTSHVCRGASG